MKTSNHPAARHQVPQQRSRVAVQLPGARLGTGPLRSRPLHVGRWFLFQCSFWLLSGLTSLLNGRVLHIDLVDQNLYVLRKRQGWKGRLRSVEFGEEWRCLQVQGLRCHARTLGEEVRILLQDRNPHLGGQTRSFALQNWVKSLCPETGKVLSCRRPAGLPSPGLPERRG